MPKCRFNKKLNCCEITHNCRVCNYFGNKTLDNSEEIDYNCLFVCPFCFSRYKLEKFFCYNKDESISRIRKCPNCNIKMTEYTLRVIKDMEIEEFAKWIFYYPRKEFWIRCKFKEFWYNLAGLGLDKPFKEAYDKLKPKIYEDENHG